MSQPHKKTFGPGEIVSYSHPSNFFLRAFGRRIFTASSEAATLAEEYLNAEKAEAKGQASAVDWIYGKEAFPPEEGNGMVLCSCFYPLHGAGTYYHKVLLGNQLFWIASEHLEKTYR